MPERSAGSSGGVLREAVPVVLVLVVALGVYTRFSHLVALTRDEAIYAYSGMRLTHGVAPYVSIWDPKLPGTSFLCAGAIEAGRLVGLGPVTAIRVVFFATALLTALALYLLGRVLWTSVPAALAGVGVFLCFRSWAFEAPSGPDAKMPGIALLVLSMALVVRRRWGLAGFAAGLAFLFWQPLLIFVAVAVVGAILVPDDGRLRAAIATLSAAAVPIIATGIYFVSVGAFRTFVDAAFVQPATGAQQSLGLVGGTRHIAHIAHRYLGFGAWILGLGLLAVLVLAIMRIVDGRWAGVRDPLVCVVTLGMLGVIAFSIRDFQNYPDLDPLLPFPAIGAGGVVAALAGHLAGASARRRYLLDALVGVVVVVLLLGSVANFDAMPGHHRLLPEQRAQACALDRIVATGRVYSLGTPVPLVLTGRVNPDQFVYLGGGVLQWKLAHLAGGIAGWHRQILSARPDVVVSRGWLGTTRDRLTSWLEGHFRMAYLGNLQVFTTPAARHRARQNGIELTAREQRAGRTSLRLYGRGCR